MEGGQAPPDLVALLDPLLDESDDWAEHLPAQEVMAELRDRGLSSGFRVVTGSIAREDEDPVEGSWLEWGEWAIVTTSEFVIVYPLKQGQRFATGGTLTQNIRAAPVIPIRRDLETS